MNPVRWKYLSAAMFVVSMTFLASVLVLPLYKSPQRAVYQGPATPYTKSGTTISGYYIPTVDEGSRVTVSIDDFLAGAIDVSIFPSQVGAISPSGGPVFVKTPQINSTEYFISDTTQPYGIYIISRNSTKFTLIVQANYSGYYWLMTYSSVAVALTIGTGVLLYYYNFTAKRWKLEQQAIREARGETVDGRRNGR
jgi:hypothetical protein